MSKDTNVTMYSKESGEFITTRFTSKKFTDKGFKLVLRKYSPQLRKVVEFVSTKKMFRKK